MCISFCQEVNWYYKSYNSIFIIFCKTLSPFTLQKYNIYIIILYNTFVIIKFREEFTMSNYKEIIDQLIELRKAKGLTQKDLATAANLTQPAIARLESKSAVPQLNTFVKVAGALGYNIELIKQS